MTIAICLIFLFGIMLVILGVCMPENKETNTDIKADKTIEEINSFSENVFAELEEKYNELLFLYRMIDEKKELEKKTDVVVEDNSGESDELGEIAQALRSRLSESVKKNYSNSKLEDIKELYEKGLSVHEIAKQLNIGHREAELIMKLGRII